MSGQQVTTERDMKHDRASDYKSVMVPAHAAQVQRGQAERRGWVNDAVCVVWLYMRSALIHTHKYSLISLKLKNTLNSRDRSVLLFLASALQCRTVTVSADATVSTGSCCLDRGFILCCGVIVSLLLTASSETCTSTLSWLHSACTSVHCSGHKGPPLSAGCHHVATNRQLRAMLQSPSRKETLWIPRNYNNHVLTLCYQKEKHLRLRLAVCNNPESRQHYFQQWEENPSRRGYNSLNPRPSASVCVALSLRAHLQGVKYWNIKDKKLKRGTKTQ